MKFSIVGPGFTPIPPVGWGAVESLIWDMRNVLIELGHEVDIVNTTDPKDIIDQINNYEPDFVHIHYDDWVGLYPYIQYPCVCTSHYGYLERPNMFIMLCLISQRRTYMLVLMELIVSHSK